MKDINFKIRMLFILAMFFCLGLVYNNEQIIKLESGNERYNFTINKSIKDFTYNEINYINQIFNMSSHGTIKIVEDTIFLQSDYNFNSIPLKILGEYVNEKKKSVIVLKKGNQTLLDDFTDVLFVINDKDTINVTSDTLRYKDKINTFFIFVKNRNDDYLEKYYKTLPKELFTREDSLTVKSLNKKLNIRLRTKTYFNKNEYNKMTVSFEVNVDLWNYQYINDTIIDNNGCFLWHSVLFDDTRVLKLLKN